MQAGSFLVLMPITLPCYVLFCVQVSDESQLQRLLAFLKQDVMDRFGVHERTLIRVRTC